MTVLLAALMLGAAIAGDQATPDAPAPAPAPATTPAPAAAPATINDADIGTGVLTRFLRYQAAEWGKAASPLPADPAAPAPRRDGWAPAPVASPPYPFTEFPFGGATSLGVNRPDAIDSPLMVALAHTGLGTAMGAGHVQAYGWIEAGGNISTSHVRQGNQPAGYTYAPNHVQLNQAVMIIERTPDTVQNDHVDWGFRVAGLYGSDYRYTASRGFLVDRGLYGANRTLGFDLPNIYAELFVPHLAEGLLIRVGRYIGVPDIEAPFAAYNYLYTRSIAYPLDNATTTGVLVSLSATKTLMLQAGVVYGTDTAAWNAKQTLPNLAQVVTPALWAQNGNGAPFADAMGRPYAAIANTLFPASQFRRDPGAMPSLTACARWQDPAARDAIYLCADGINSGTWGYNNQQWFGGTWFHRFSPRWHTGVEAFVISQRHVVNVDRGSPGYFIYYAGGTPFSPQVYAFNGPAGAQCADPTAAQCTAHAFAAMQYTNWQAGPRDNVTLRTEFFNDAQGQRTGTKSRYWDVSLGVQHWFSPQVEVRPEVAYYRSTDAAAFNIDPVSGDVSHARTYQLLLAGDLVVHF